MVRSLFTRQPSAMSTFYGTAPENLTAKWQPEPTFRGTYSILSSCLLTMGLCIWTAVHLNIPEHGHKGFVTPQLRRKIMWLFIGLFAPEIIAWVAYEQRRAASRVYTKMKRVLKQADKPNVLRRIFCMSPLMRLLWKEKIQSQRSFDNRHEWTMTHSYYAAMGGFAIDVSDKQIQFFASERFSQFTLTVDGFLWVADWGLDLIPNISEAEIRDKSKASGLAKTLVCVQATWFCVQCVFRLSQKLTISLLELNTFAHALCTLVIYLLWWDKPLDIEERTVLRGENIKESTALLLVASMGFGSHFANASQRGHSRVRRLDVNRNRESDLGRKWFRGNTPKENTLSYAPLPPPGDISPRPASFSILTGHIVDGQILDTIQHHPYPRQHGIKQIWKVYRKSQPNHIPQPYRITLNRTEYACLKMAIKEGRHRNVDWPWFTPLTFRIDEWSDDLFSIRMYFSFCISSLCYGGIHLTAWSAPFRTPLQMVLWRLSSLGLTMSGPAMLIWIAYDWVYDILEEKQLNCLSYAGPAIFLLFLCFYVFCRVFLVVECFIGITQVPDSVYQVPTWSEYFPHIG
ncbi:hypothetical protein K505DRAFT_412747 [Melanomma pulvis-pyrius CBS 109.77]|uniref:Uncharacterized protein n=1 Tax=Melanomma pulvis-pyrius CBS 109.77 TaxID=1314802 RepID=A0A6A6XVX1_9PLEO|nr:hypothetical protein K505DRAFT_412747 [Melanomma pulvis-pyrius CBS 109.77]